MAERGALMQRVYSWRVAAIFTGLLALTLVMAACGYDTAGTATPSGL
jgi:hypothetical protein